MLICVNNRVITKEECNFVGTEHQRSELSDGQLSRATTDKESQILCQYASENVKNRIVLSPFFSCFWRTDSDHGSLRLPDQDV